MICDLIQKIFDLQSLFNMVVLSMVVVMGAGVVTTLVVQIRKFACHWQELN